MFGLPSNIIDYYTNIDTIEYFISILQEKNGNQPQFQNELLAFNYWRGAFDLAKNADSRREVKELTKKYIFGSNDYWNPEFIIAQGIIIVLINTLRKKLYQFEFPGVTDQENEFIVASNYMRALCEEIAAENNETIEEADIRIYGSK